MARYDPDAQRRTETARARPRLRPSARVMTTPTPSSVWGRLLATGRRRAAASGSPRWSNGLCARVIRAAPVSGAPTPLGAIAERQRRTWPAACGSPACPPPGGTPKSHVVIRVIAEQAAVEAATNEVSGAARTHRPSPALLLGHGVLPNALLAEAIRTGATIKPIQHPRRRARAAVSALDRAGRVRPDARSVLPLPRLRRARRTAATSTMPGPGRGAPPTPQTSTASAENIT